MGTNLEQETKKEKQSWRNLDPTLTMLILWIDELSLNAELAISPNTILLVAAH